MARPTKYNKEVAEEICDLISSTNQGLNSICRSGKFPSARTVYRWLRDNKEFCQMYAIAKEEQADFMAEQILEIADDTTNDTIYGDMGARPDKEWINRSRLRVDARKWLMAKLAPLKYGDKMELNVTEIPAPVIELSIPEVGFTLNQGNAGKAQS